MSGHDYFDLTNERSQQKFCAFVSNHINDVIVSAAGAQIRCEHVMYSRQSELK